MPDQPLHRNASARAADLLRRFLRGKIGVRRLLGSTIRYLILEVLGVHVIAGGGPAAIVFSHKKLYPHIDQLVGQIQSLQADKARLQTHIADLVPQVRRMTSETARLRAVEKHVDHVRAEKDAVAAERDVAQAGLAALEIRLRDVAAAVMLRLESTRRDLEVALGEKISDPADTAPDAEKGAEVDLLSALVPSSRVLEATGKRLIAQHSNLLAQYNDLIGSSRELMEGLERRIFEVGTPQPGAGAAVSGMMAGRPADEILRSFIANSERFNGSRHFRAVAAAFAPRRTLTGSLHAELLPKLGKFRIIDLGSEMLSYEDDIYAPLARNWPCDVVGFDPFSSAIAGNGVDVARSDGRQVRTIATLVGDGEPADFRINQSGPTSSIRIGNVPLVQQFGLLAASLKTVETRRLPTRRLDDLLQEGLLFDGAIDFLKIDVQGTAHEVLAHGRETLGRSLVVHVEVELAEVYLKERLFGDVDQQMREAGFDLVDFYSLGRMRYSSLNPSNARFFHAGRLLWVDAVYLSGLDGTGQLNGERLLRAAVMMHEIYNKQDLAAELFLRYDRESGENMAARYLEICSLEPGSDPTGRPKVAPRREEARK